MTDTPMEHQSPDAFTDARILVTGGTRGLGAAIARRFADAGARVIVAARTPVRDPPAGTFVRADVSTPEGVMDLAKRSLDIVWGIDVLVDNAGGSSHVPDGVLAMTDDDWLRDLNASLLSAVRLDRALLPSMIEQQSGVVIHVTSGAARLPQPSALPYAAAKAALTTYSKGLANEVGPHGIRVNAVVPGFIKSDAHTRSLEKMARETGSDLETVRQQLVDSFGIPLGRAGEGDDVARLVVFLASPAGAYLTGSQYVVDGGLIPTV